MQGAFRASADRRHVERAGSERVRSRRHRRRIVHPGRVAAMAAELHSTGSRAQEKSGPGKGPASRVGRLVGLTTGPAFDSPRSQSTTNTTAVRAGIMKVPLAAL